MRGIAGEDLMPDDRRMAFLLNLRQRGIADPGVLRAMDEVPRDRFVREGQQSAAFADHALPIACGQTISQPYVVAYMTEQLALQSDHRVLEIGTGSGYQAAILSRLVRDVVSIERYRTLADSARERLRSLGYDNVEVRHGDGALGAPDKAPFDRIIVTAAVADVPSALIEQLAFGGMMILPLGPAEGEQSLAKITRSREGQSREVLLPVRFVPLVAGMAREL
jgi:protein-L-isoaspartate(D-aspartate) O-methyltransferase